VESAKRFYGDTIGWTFEPMSSPSGTYWIAKMGDQYVGGLFPLTGPEFADMPEGWMSYLAVDNVDARLNRAVAAGATTCREPFDVEGVGRIAILKDPGGAMIGWMTPVSS
jgi:predicted enzyme related to lactoylglutathione lyase